MLRLAAHLRSLGSQARPCTPNAGVRAPKLARLAFTVAALATVAACSRAPAGVGQLEQLRALEDAPLQENTERELLDIRGGFRVTRVARYVITARVLGVQHYRWDVAASAAPVDLALAWGPVADPDVISQLKISQSGRWYHWRTRSNVWPLARRVIEVNSANVHIVPETDEVLAFVRSLEPGEVVTLQGWLVDLTEEDGAGGMRTSLTRKDTGAGACEILYVTAARRTTSPE